MELLKEREHNTELKVRYRWREENNAFCDKAELAGSFLCVD